VPKVVAEPASPEPEAEPPTPSVVLVDPPPADEPPVPSVVAEPAPQSELDESQLPLPAALPPVPIVVLVWA
jgi:hypothetical protein